MSFVSSEKRLSEIISSWDKPREESVKFGIDFLDMATDGIYSGDLVVLTARTGAGKTEFLSNVLYSGAKSGKIIHMFALEAERNEIENRILFRQLANAFYFCTRERDEVPNYQLWVKGKQDHLLKKFQPEVIEELSKVFKNQFTYYTEEGFNTESFENQMHLIEERTDLVILDHLHFMDYEDANDNQGLKKTIKEIKRIVNFFKKPVLIAAQLRKGEKYSEELLPGLDDIFGSSEIVKIATRVIALAPGGMAEKNKNIRQTYMRVLKNRLDGEKTFYSAICGYDFTRNNYSPTFVLGRLKKNNTVFEELRAEDYPQWARYKNTRTQAKLF
jgi:replicative DNA helicase